MNSMTSKGLVAISSLAALLALGACGQRADETTVGQKVDAGVAKTEQAAAESGAAMKDAGNRAETAVMGAAADTRSVVSDAEITAKVNAGLAADKDLSAIKINVDTKDGIVTLNGPVPNASAKDRASEIARNVKDVKSVDNQLNVQPG
jgi:hyperosmotically inducible periplasmic protein